VGDQGGEHLKHEASLSMARIAIGGWQHETNTFASINADYEAFVRQDDWPPLCVGEAMLRETAGVHLPITGAIATLVSHRHELVPLLWCSATPCSYVTEHAFETISAQFISLLERAAPLDGVYLDLHGAMVCEHLEDGEGEFLGRVRDVVGDNVPIVCSLDLHANVTPLMVEKATALDAFRTYPHIDMAETGARAALLLSKLLESGTPLFCGFRQIPFIIPLNAGCTLIEPCRTLYGAIPALITDDVAAVSFAAGFHLSDIHDVGPSVVSYGYSRAAADQAVDALTSRIIASRDAFSLAIWPAVEGVMEAQRLLAAGSRTIVLADTQDNPGGGGSGDTTGLLQTLVNAGIGNAFFGAVADAEVAARAHREGVGAEFDALLGGKSGLAGQTPWPCRCRVLALGDGNIIGTGPMYRGARMAVGPSALLEISGVHVMLVSNAVHVADQAVLRHVGIEPSNYSVVAIKSSVHFRNDFTDLADEILVVAAPGAVFCDPAKINYRRKRIELPVSDI